MIGSGGRTGVSARITTALVLRALAVVFVLALAPSPSAAQQADGDAAAPAAEDGGDAAQVPVPPAVQPEPKPPMLIAKPEKDPLLPRPRPDPDAVAEAPEPEPEPVEPVAPEITTGAVPEPQDSEQEACLWRLRGLGAAATPIPLISASDTCQLAAPLAVSELSLEISLYPEATLGCAAAEAMTMWMQEVVIPAARRHLDAEPTGLVQSSAFACSDGGTSNGADEHALGSAIDITGVIFKEYDTIAIRMRDGDKGAEKGRERAFQRAIREGACRFFDTVLGPGSEAGHENKLHLGLSAEQGAATVCR